MWVTLKVTAEERVPSLRHIDESIGAYVTAGARIHVTRYLDRLQQNAINCDTNAVIIIQSRNEPDLFETGNKLGDMTSQVKLISSHPIL